MNNNQPSSREVVLGLLEDKLPGNVGQLDLRVSTFVAALNSYRRNSILKPFPPTFVQSDEKQFDKLKEVLDKIPSLDKLDEITDLSDETWQLLNWILTNGLFKLRLLPPQESSKIINSTFRSDTKQTANRLAPFYIFEISGPSRPKFESAKDQWGSFHAFHGSKVENFHSIMHNGLINCLNKRDLYGEGTYLSSKLDVSVEFSPFGSVWPKSTLGQRLSCVAMCDVVRHPDIVTDNAIPKAYHVVRNDDHINVSHILVYRASEIKSCSSANFLVILFVGAILVLLVSLVLPNYKRWLKS